MFFCRIVSPGFPFSLIEYWILQIGIFIKNISNFPLIRVVISDIESDLEISYKFFGEHRKYWHPVTGTPNILVFELFTNIIPTINSYSSWKYFEIFTKDSLFLSMCISIVYWIHHIFMHGQTYTYVL